MAKDPEVIIDHDLVAGSAPDGFDFGYDDKTTKTTKTEFCLALPSWLYAPPTGLPSRTFLSFTRLRIRISLCAFTTLSAAN